MKTATTVIVVAMAFLAIAGCGNQASSASQSAAPEPAASSVTSEPAAPPSVGLHEAAFLGDVESIRQHVEASSNLDEKDSFGSTPLIIATTFGAADAAEALIKGGADLSQVNSDGSTSLHIAAFLCRTQIVEALIEGGADKVATNNAGRTALQSVEGPFEEKKATYDELGAGLAPMGLKLDYDHIRVTRPVIAEMLRS